MGTEELTIGFNTFLSLIFGLGGALGVWFKLKGKVDLMQSEIDNLQLNEIKVHNRIDALKLDVKENKEKSDKTIDEMKKSISEMELRIIQAIHEIGKNNG